MINNNDELSKLIRQAGIRNNPGNAYFDSFLPRYKMYRNAKSRRQKIVVAFTLIVVTLFSTLLVVEKLHRNTLDIQTASGIENESK